MVMVVWFGWGLKTRSENYARSRHQRFGHDGYLAAVVGDHVQDAPANWDIEVIGGTCSGKEVDLWVPESRRHRLTGTDNGRA